MVWFIHKVSGTTLHHLDRHNQFRFRTNWFQFPFSLCRLSQTNFVWHVLSLSLSLCLSLSLLINLNYLIILVLKCLMYSSENLYYLISCVSSPHVCHKCRANLFGFRTIRPTLIPVSSSCSCSRFVPIQLFNKPI